MDGVAWCGGCPGRTFRKPEPFSSVFPYGHAECVACRSSGRSPSDAVFRGRMETRKFCLSRKLPVDCPTMSQDGSCPVGCDIVSTPIGIGLVTTRIADCVASAGMEAVTVQRIRTTDSGHTAANPSSHPHPAFAGEIPDPLRSDSVVDSVSLIRHRRRHTLLYCRQQDAASPL